MLVAVRPGGDLDLPLDDLALLALRCGDLGVRPGDDLDLPLALLALRCGDLDLLALCFWGLNLPALFLAFCGVLSLGPPTKVKEGSFSFVFASLVPGTLVPVARSSVELSSSRTSTDESRRESKVYMFLLEFVTYAFLEVQDIAFDKKALRSLDIFAKGSDDNVTGAIGLIGRSVAGEDAKAEADRHLSRAGLADLPVAEARPPSGFSSLAAAIFRCNPI